MKDRIPTRTLSNGAVRFAEYDASGKFVQYRYLVLADEPTQQGTPLNKANLLSDLTAEIIGFEKNDDPTIDSALAKIAQKLNAIPGTYIHCIGLFRLQKPYINVRFLLPSMQAEKYKTMAEIILAMPQDGDNLIELPAWGQAKAYSDNATTDVYSIGVENSNVLGTYIVAMGMMGSSPYGAVDVTSAETIKDYVFKIG